MAMATGVESDGDGNKEGNGNGDKDGGQQEGKGKGGVTIKSLCNKIVIRLSLAKLGKSVGVFKLRFGS
jgi:hypothetical protein